MLSALLLPGCEESDNRRPFTLHLSGGERALETFTVIAADNGETFELSCPNDATSRVSCTADTVVFGAPAGPVSATVKAPGFAFVSKRWTAETLDEKREAHLRLSPLAPFETEADYATGFGQTSGRDAFLQYAHRSASDLGPQYVVKFYIENMNDAPTVYFMNTPDHPLHYRFVHDVLGRPLSEMEYMQQTYVDPERDAMAGTLLYYPSAEISRSDKSGAAAAPMLMTFFASDKLTPDHAATAHRLIEERLGFRSLFGTADRLFYLPPGEQQRTDLAAHEADLRAAGILWMSKADLYGETSIQILNEGEAYGTLRLLSGEALETAVFSYRDILLLSSLPAKLPLAGGTITESLQTPLSHVNVAAMNRGTPNIALPGAADREEIAALVGSLVHFSVSDGGYLLEPADRATAEAFWAARQRPPVSVDADTAFSEMRDLKDIAFGDSIRFGAKAANVAELVSVLPDVAPDGFAVPFYYYDQFIDETEISPNHCGDAKADCIEEGRNEALCASAETACRSCAGGSLRQYIEAVSARDDFSTDAAAREALLDGIRYHFRHLPTSEGFATALDSKVADTFGSEKIRLRSSTNAEDLPEFTGAGLYESVSAYADRAGDLPSEEIRKVWASIWNFRAYEERRFWSIDHSSVHMGVLVHRAFPNEAANGVLITRNLQEKTVDGFYVNVQLGEHSVTNPEAGSPEIFAIVPGASGTPVQAAVYAYSSLMPEQSILTPDETVDLYTAAAAAQRHFAELYDIAYLSSAVFEMEFKFHGPERRLYIKQLRPF